MSMVLYDLPPESADSPNKVGGIAHWEHTDKYANVTIIAIWLLFKRDAVELARHQCRITLPDIIQAGGNQNGWDVLVALGTNSSDTNDVAQKLKDEWPALIWKYWHQIPGR